MRSDHNSAQENFKCNIFALILNDTLEENNSQNRDSSEP